MSSDMMGAAAHLLVMETADSSRVMHYVQRNRTQSAYLSDSIIGGKQQQ